MLKGSPFHARALAACESWEWQAWSGYLSASSYSIVPYMEYYALRHTAGLIDVSPLYKYHIRGSDARALLNKVVTRDLRKLSKGHIIYTPWCDENGKTIDDGTLWCFADGTFRLTSATPNLKWLEDNGTGLDVAVEDVSEDIGALSIQGPSSRAILKDAVGDGIDRLKFFRFTETKLDGIPVEISRTGYTGDLGYEIWVERDRGERLWDALMKHGAKHGLQPAGQVAMDVCRIEAGLILGEVDYVHARTALVDVQRYSPFELSLDWAVALDKGPFVGRRALRDELRRGIARRVVGIEIDWPTASKYFTDLGLPPMPPAEPWSSKIPVYSGMRQVGWGTSGCWSPTVKKYIGLATVRSPYVAVGTPLEIDIEVEWERRRAPALVVERPFYDPPQRKA
ncbi:MAG TPA: aminomethyltransferase family protein [Thermoplasmata archaeon]|nr:aminomethyltransferase family protein [Thermoplasmata archaeon]